MMDDKRTDELTAEQEVVWAAVYVWKAWNGKGISLPNAVMRLRAALKSAGISVSKPGPDLHKRVETWYRALKFQGALEKVGGDDDGP